MILRGLKYPLSDYLFYLFVVLIRWCGPVGIAFWPESHFEDFMWLHAVFTAHVTALAVFQLTTFLEVSLHSCLQILTITGYMPYFQFMDSLFADLCTALRPKKIEMTYKNIK